MRAAVPRAFGAVLLILLWAAAPSRAEQVTMSYTATTLTFLPGMVAVDHGFFRDEKLDVRLVQLRAALVLPALANGHIDYTMSFLPAVDGALKRFPVKVTAVFVDRALHYLVARPEIRAVPELRGKTFVLNTVDLNSSTGLVFQAVVRHFGIDPHREVKLLHAPDSPALFNMVYQGLADATMLVPPWPHQARKAGLRVLFRAGEIFNAPLASLSTHHRTLRENPAQVRRMLRALIRSTRFILEPKNRPAVLATVGRWLKLPAEEGEGALNDVLFAYSDGLRDEKGFWTLIEQRAKLLGSDVPVAEVADFSLVKDLRAR
jgi:NitT/TauT family transport system substrate-binding protein